eukprot:m.60811 g.60811  ORF g.60811 m.60811 type:complete len:368 (+) comp16124_c0_seq1:109-1212(+)
MASVELSKCFDEHLVLSKEKSHYNRSSSPEYEQAVVALKRLYGATDAFLLPSGMNSIATTLQVLGIARQWATFNLVVGDELYCDSPRLFKWFQANYRCVEHLQAFTPDNDAQLLDLFRSKALRGKDNVLHVESCSNPTGKIFNLALIPELRKLSRSLTVVVDNTWLSGSILNPLQHGADIVVCSMTKYYSGGACIGGAIMSLDATFLKQLEEYVRVTGVHVSPVNAELIYRGICGQLDRIKHSSAVTQQVLAAVTGHPKVLQLIHPLLPHHASHARALELFRKVDGQQLGPSVFTFVVRCKSKNATRKILAGFHKIEHKTSFGAPHARSDPWPEVVGEGQVMIRIAVGYEDDAEQLAQALKELMDRF